ncbi:hypothetical protein GCM10023081_20130 [Arthrobacter ginkgonis]|uniref:Uncharacterized protein n=1 Tax=Arthrobacter ginkgonis TaxID=1630594 RepID=A0ABP7C9R0_9MICC
MFGNLCRRIPILQLAHSVTLSPPSDNSENPHLANLAGWGFVSCLHAFEVDQEKIEGEPEQQERQFVDEVRIVVFVVEEHGSAFPSRGETATAGGPLLLETSAVMSPPYVEAELAAASSREPSLSIVATQPVAVLFLSAEKLGILPLLHKKPPPSHAAVWGFSCVQG